MPQIQRESVGAGYAHDAGEKQGGGPERQVREEAGVPVVRKHVPGESSRAGVARMAGNVGVPPMVMRGTGMPARSRRSLSETTAARQVSAAACRTAGSDCRLCPS